MRLTARLLLLLVAILSLGACSETDLIREAHPTTLAGTAWRVVSINGRSPVAGSEPTAVFAAADISGSAGCNSYGGKYTYDANSGAIAFDNFGMTLMGCPGPALQEVEAAFSQAMVKVVSASMDETGRLVLSGPAAEIILVVDAIPA